MCNSAVRHHDRHSEPSNPCVSAGHGIEVFALSTTRRADLGLHDAIELFLTTREVQNCEAVTIVNYRRVLTRFATTPCAPAMVSGITDDVLVLWLSRLRRDGL